MKRYIYILLCLFFVFSSLLCKAQSQKIEDLHNKIGQTLDSYREQSKSTSENNNLSDDYKQTYEKLKKLYIKKQESESVKKSNELLLAFTEKMNIKDEAILFDLRHYADTIEWIKDNIGSTSFQNIEEAIEEYENYLEISIKEYEENEEFFTYMLSAVNRFGSEIFAEISLDYEINNPNSILNKALYNKKK